MSDTRCWSKEMVTNFITVYRENPCVWKVKSKEYANRNLRNEAYDKLAALCRPVFPEANREFVTRKIQSLRGSFRKELKKVSDSMRSGVLPDDVYCPSLWYYDMLLFTKDQELPSTRTEHVKCEGDYDDDELGMIYYEDDSTEVDDYGAYEQQLEQAHMASPSKRTLDNHTNLDGGGKRNKLDSQVAVKTHNSDISEYEATGIGVARKLERMDATQAVYAESLISVILRKGLLNSLTENTVVSENCYKHPHP